MAYDNKKYDHSMVIEGLVMATESFMNRTEGTQQSAGDGSIFHKAPCFSRQGYFILVYDPSIAPTLFGIAP